jgi:hypothetical protein
VFACLSSTVITSRAQDMDAYVMFIPLVISNILHGYLNLAFGCPIPVDCTET